jgi:hypothetical protein
VEERRIRQRGERVEVVRKRFRLMEMWGPLRADEAPTA